MLDHPKGECIYDMHQAENASINTIEYGHSEELEELDEFFSKSETFKDDDEDHEDDPYGL